MTTGTLPYCGSCGWDLKENMHDDMFCDACGADVHRFAPEGILDPPTETSVTPGTGDVTFAWAKNPQADSEESRYAVGFTANWTEWVTDTSPTTITQPTGSAVTLEVRSVIGDLHGPPLVMLDTTG